MIEKEAEKPAASVTVAAHICLIFIYLFIYVLLGDVGQRFCFSVDSLRHLSPS